MHGTEAQLAALDPAAVLGLRHIGYGAEALVERERVPAGTEITPVGLEDIFVFMVKDARGPARVQA